MLPNVKSKANFLALSNNRGMYRNDKMKHTQPSPTHIANPINL